jgi:transposase
MKHRVGLERSQTWLFPERLEDYVGPENPVRFLEAFVAQQDLAALGFTKARCADTGRPPYDPAVLLKLYLYGYLHRLRSSRRLEAECQRNVELIWLTGKLAPDFKTIADFRKDNVQALQAVARQFTLLCRKLDLFGGELLAIDGSKFKAVNGRERNFNASKLQELLAHTDARLAEYFQALDQAEAAPPASAPLTRARRRPWRRRSRRCRRNATGTPSCWPDWMQRPNRSQSPIRTRGACGQRRAMWWAITRRWPWMRSTN